MLQFNFLLFFILDISYFTADTYFIFSDCEIKTPVFNYLNFISIYTSLLEFICDPSAIQQMLESFFFTTKLHTPLQ